MDRYVDASRGFFKILGDYSPEVEGLSLDEAFLDLTGSERLLGEPRGVAETIKRRVRAELRSLRRVGVAPIKFAAKIASDIDKPDGLRVVAPERAAGVPARAAGDAVVGRRRGDARGAREHRPHDDRPGRALSGAALIGKLGEVTGRHLAALARGDDPRPVVSEREAVTIGHQETFEHDLDDKGEIGVILLDQADRVAARLRAAELRARVVVLTVKYDDFRLITRRMTLAAPTSDGSLLGHTAIDLLGKVSIESRRGARIRLCGVSAQELEPRDAPRQLGFDEAARARGERLGRALDDVAAKFGRGSVRRAVHLGESEDD